MGRIRAFIALPLCDEAVKATQRVQQDIVKQQQGLRLSAPENLHLTLHFFGEVESDDAISVMKGLGQRLQGFEPFTLNIKKLGAFPDKRRARVVWLGVDSPKLKELWEAATSVLQSRGMPIKDDFHPHLTIARSRRFPVDVTRLVTKVSVPECLVRRVVLFQSTLTPRGPIYQALEAIFL
jgi:2'-5' RNA ligase